MQTTSVRPTVADHARKLHHLESKAKWLKHGTARRKLADRQNQNTHIEAEIVKERRRWTDTAGGTIENDQERWRQTAETQYGNRKTKTRNKVSGYRLPSLQEEICAICPPQERAGLHKNVAVRRHTRRLQGTHSLRASSYFPSKHGQ